MSVLCLLPLPAAALSILPGQSYEVPFSLSGPAPTADVLTFNLGPGTTAVGFTGFVVSLYDGNTLLGSLSSAVTDPKTLTAFVSSGSLWTTNAVTTDLSSIQDGSINGLIVLTPTFDGSPGAVLDVAFFPATGLVVGQANGSDSLVPLSSGSVIIGTPFALPEPGALPLLAIAALLGITAPSRGRRAGR